MRPKAFLALLRERIETVSARLLEQGLREGAG